jgi:hypothetical protein
MEERRLPGETEAAWNQVRDGEVWTYRVWASPYLPDAGLSRVRAGGADGAGGGAQGDGGGREPVLLGAGRSPSRPREACLVDACQVRGVGAQVLAALRAFLVSLLHRRGVREKKAALEAFAFNPLAALRFLGLYAV